LIHVTAASVEKKVNGSPVASPEPRFDPVALAEAEAIRTRAAAEADAARAKAAAEAKAAEILAAEEAEKLRLANERARLAQERKQADHDAYLAKKAAEAAKSKVDEEKAAKVEAEQKAVEAKREAEKKRSESWWKWGARGIYAVGLVIAAPVQFMHFWDRQRPFLLAAPALLEGFALVLAFGAAWAVAHRRDVAPYRVGIMLGAAIAAAINMYGGLSDERIGFNAGLIGAIASLGGPIVLMAYEHGIAQKADGIPSWRERRAADKAEQEATVAREKARTEKQAADAKAATEKVFREQAAEEEQARKDDDRKAKHLDVWEVADAVRSARGFRYVTDQIWAECWFLVTGCKTVGIRAEIEAQSRAAQAAMRTVTDAPVLGSFSQLDSQRPPREKRDPNAPDGRRNNGGTPPLRVAGDAPPPSPAARAQARIERTTEKKD
jgi:peptide methionine sulfoxide reductase MsrB